MKYNKLPIFLVFALLACILAMGSVSAADTNNPTGLANSSYPEYGINNNHTSQSNYTGPQTNTTKWNITTECITGGTAVTGPNGTVYVASKYGTFYAVNPNGTVLWTYDVSAASSAPAIGNNGTIYVLNTNGVLYALTLDGKFKWTCNTATNAGTSYSNPVIGADGTIYLISTYDYISSSDGGKLYAITDNGNDATIKWTYAINATMRYAPAISSDGTIYITGDTGILYALTNKGTYATQKWNLTLGNNFEYSSPSIGADGTIYIGGNDGTLYAVTDNGGSGAVKWQSATDGSIIYGTPSISSNGIVYVITQNGNVYAFNATNGYAKWSYTVGSEVTGVSIVIGSDGTVYVGTRTGTLYALTDTGEYATLKWSYATGRIACAPVIGSDGTLYVGTTTGVFYAFQDLKADFTNSTTNATVTFKDNSTNIPTNWNWSFGDGSTSTEQNPTHTYTASGKYTVTLTVTNANGVQNTTTKTIYIVLASANPVGGNYSNGQTVNLTTDDTNATIYYTLNGTDPTVSGTKYTNPLTISKTTTVKYAAVDNGNWSSIYTQTYTIAPTVTASPVGGSYNTSKTATLKTDDTNAVIYYTTNGTDPKLYGTKYTSPLTISKTTTLKYVAVKDGNWGVVTTQTYTIDKTAPTASASVKAGTYNTNKIITLKMSEAGTIYYTTNGATPTTSSKKYTGAFTISSTATLKFIAVDKAGNKSPVYTAKYVIDKTRPYVKSMYPKKSSTGISRSNTLYLKFSENINTSINWSKVYIKNLKTGKKVAVSKVIKNNVLYLKTGKRSAYTWYQIYIPAAAIKDAAGNNGIGYTWKFKTGRY
ncbi:chitobiase/beta-hexosaminidase C-terminal domain-containing protein [Methanobacterium sp. MBAC-LM]|uniref:chitobiase/beta-hexosaminidase C-terminal domain-containing protein n=1 Tax=Methanobacterium sp. MBAC-LM TaxID=3412034 RepID=UPI003C78FA08